MHLLIIALIAFANLMFPDVNGLDAARVAWRLKSLNRLAKVSRVNEWKRAGTLPAAERVAECASAATHADLPKDHPGANKLACDTTKAFYACVIKPFNSDSNSEMLDFTRAYVLQHVILLNKENLCPEPLPYQELKELVEKSGIMERENLPSVENDQYVPCAGEVRKACSSEVTKLWAHHVNDLEESNDFIGCYEEEADRLNCDYPITRHMITLLQAMKNHFEAKKGELGGMLEEIKQ